MQQVALRRLRAAPGESLGWGWGSGPPPHVLLVDPAARHRNAPVGRGVRHPSRRQRTACQRRKRSPDRRGAAGSAEYPRGGRGGAATRFHGISTRQPRRRRELVSPSSRPQVDEAQDLDECMLAVVECQRKRGPTTVILVGDPAQSLYGFRGASADALRDSDRFGRADSEFALARSFRFGPAIAREANRLLSVRRRYDRSFQFQPVVGCGPKDRTGQGAGASVVRSWATDGLPKAPWARRVEISRRRDPALRTVRAVWRGVVTTSAPRTGSPRPLLRGRSA